jgi:hypothetical protein
MFQGKVKTEWLTKGALSPTPIISTTLEGARRGSWFKPWTKKLENISKISQA